MKILVTGKNGQVALSLLDLNSDDIEVIARGRPELDITDKASVDRALDHYKPDIVVNAAAYTFVDKAETEPAQAFLINRDGARNVAQATKERDLPIIHISTDYVFSGDKSEPYVETDPVGPINVYGLSKLEGEWAVQQENPDHVILRTAWVYSPYGSNFVKTMLRLAETRDEISVVSDQWGNPTSARMIAHSIVEMTKQVLAPTPPSNWRGIFHLVADGVTNWADFSRAIFQFSSRDMIKNISVLSIRTDEYITLAKRPANSSLSVDKICRIFDTKPQNWKIMLKEHFS